MPRTRVKICGLTSDGDVDAAADAGADAIGFVFSESVRRITLDTADRLLGYVPAFLNTVAVFSTPDFDLLHLLTTRILPGFDCWQMNADAWEQASAVPRAPVVIPVFRWGVPGKWSVTNFDRGDTTPLIEGPRSGSGEAIDWNAVAPVARGRRIILAGGLTPDNVAQAIRTVRPYGVDVSSGVESSPGKKDPIKIRDFLQAVRDVDRELQ